jgi:hypothetical protein
LAHAPRCAARHSPLAMICVFLGAGFSAVGGVPLASQLFDSRPEVDRITREHLVDRVLSGWSQWKVRINGAHLERNGAGGQWRDAVRYVSLVIALSMGTVREISYRRQRPSSRRTSIGLREYQLTRSSGRPYSGAPWMSRSSPRITTSSPRGGSEIYLVPVGRDLAYSMRTGQRSWRGAELRPLVTFAQSLLRERSRC